MHTTIFRRYLHKLEGYPVPEQPDEPLMDRYYSSEDSEVSTPTPRGANKHQYSWSDDTLAGSLTGRSSVDSWAGEYVSTVLLNCTAPRVGAAIACPLGAGPHSYGEGDQDV